MKAPSPEYLEQLQAELELEREQLQLEREEFRKFVKPAMHAFAKLVPGMPLFVQQQHRTLLAEEFAHLVHAITELRALDVGLDNIGSLALARLRARLDHLVAQCAKP